MLSVQVTEVSVHAVLDRSSVMRWMVVAKVRVECGWRQTDGQTAGSLAIARSELYSC